jgi:hypothetical protein
MIGLTACRSGFGVEGDCAKEISMIGDRDGWLLEPSDVFNEGIEKSVLSSRL